jgi:hypothetical protein
LNIRANNDIRPPLRLDVDNVESESIPLDDAVDSFITAAADCCTGIVQRARVAHRNAELHEYLPPSSAATTAPNPVCPDPNCVEKERDRHPDLDEKERRAADDPWPIGRWQT